MSTLNASASERATKRVRIGVTGHRSLSDRAALTARVGEAIALIRERFTHPIELTVVSALAEGADRVVAHAVLATAAGALDAVLPLPAEEYVRDFRSQQSIGEFRELLEHAQVVNVERDCDNREHAYECAGRAIVDTCDVLVALWDGEPARGRGGTAEIVDYARSVGRTVVWINSNPPHEITVLDHRAPRVAPREFGPWHAETLGRAVDDQIARQRERWTPRDASSVDDLPLHDLMDWIVPDFAAADLIALRYQQRYEQRSAILFTLPVLAVLAVTIQAMFFERLHMIAIAEVAFLLGVLALFGIMRRRAYHERWISHRFLAERLRSSYFLGLFGDRPSRRGDDDDEEYLTDPSIWIRQAIDDIWSRRPAVAVPEHQVGPLREYLARYWIDQQADYHARAHRVHDRKERRLRYATIILFAVALVAATAHILVRERSGQDRSAMASALVTASLVTPAIGAALHGVGTQRQHRRHAETYERMEKLLRKRGERMRKAGTLAEARRVAESVERLTRDENSDWFGITRFHDVDLVT